jgi:hypothetical protein
MKEDLPDFPDDSLDAYFSAMRQREIPDGPSQQQIAQTTAALTAAAQRRPSILSRLNNMRFITGMAASVVIAVGAVFAAIVMLRSPTVTFAEVLATVRSVHAVSFVESVSTPAQALKMKILYNDQGQYSILDDQGVRSVADQKSGRVVELDTRTKTAIVMDMRNMPKQNYPQDPLESFKKMEGSSAHDMGKAQIDGKTAEKFAATVVGQQWVIWADPRTRQPIRIDMTFSLAGQNTTASMTNFDFDPSIPEDAFSQEIPKGYTVQSLAFELPDVSNPEQNVVELLRGYAQRCDGKFPDKLDDTAPYMKVLMQNSFPKGAATNPSELHFTPTSAEMQLLARFWAVQKFLDTLPKGGWRYSGAGKTMGDKSAIVFWYKTGSGYRAILGDLTAKDLEEAPQ